MFIFRATVSAVSCLVVPAFICIDLLISCAVKLNDDDDDGDDDDDDDICYDPIIACEGVAAESVTADPVSCTAMSMVFFERLYDNTVVRDSGHIVKCFDDFYEDFIISDELRKAGCALF